ncbi:MAG TPA: ABC transporter permease [Verrucomicrobiae bacterium]|nr:ABC transporter permease [Verrucomicrobiae bacterium]
MNILTEFREGAAISWSAIRANKLRSILTTLGIVIGVVTVTLMGAAIQGLNRAFVNSISFIGADVLYIQREDWFVRSHEDWEKMRKRDRITLAQANALEQQISLASAVSISGQTTESVKYKKHGADRVTIVGTTEQFMSTSGLTIAEGRFFSGPEARGGRPVCVIGAMVATNLFGSGSPLGNKIYVGEQRLEVIGVLEKQGGIFGGAGVDNQVIVPLPQFVSSFTRHPDYGIQVKVARIDRMDDAREELRAAMRRVRHLVPTDPDDFAINQQDQVLTTFHQVAGTIAAVGLFVTGLSLFVGGIGIMNIMFVSVAERTREIGIRKAIGAKRRTILIQFLLEAAGICLFGGLIALAIAWPLIVLMGKFLPATMSAPIIGVALIVALATGIASGFFPAWRAARMNPVDALRHE